MPALSDLLGPIIHHLFVSPTRSEKNKEYIEKLTLIQKHELEKGDVVVLLSLILQCSNVVFLLEDDDDTKGRVVFFYKNEKEEVRFISVGLENNMLTSGVTLSELKETHAYKHDQSVYALV
jgi:hypothetical protein